MTTHKGRCQTSHAIDAGNKTCLRDGEATARQIQDQKRHDERAEAVDERARIEGDQRTRNGFWLRDTLEPQCVASIALS